MIRSTSPAGLDFSSPPMQLWEKAKTLGTWDPAEIDLSADARHWSGLNDGERDLVLRLASLFRGGQESVMVEMLPLMTVIAGEGRLEEAMYLTSLPWEEAKHVEAFHRFLAQVAEERGDLSRYHGESWRRIFGDALPAAMRRLATDASPAAQAVAVVTCNVMVEGVLAETGYHAYDALLGRNQIMPGMQRMVASIRRDVARHVAYGVYLLSRLLAEHGDPVWEAIEATLNALLAPALGVIAEVFAAYQPVPFGLRGEELTDHALSQFRRRVAGLEKARARTPEQAAATVLDDEEEG